MKETLLSFPFGPNQHNPAIPMNSANVASFVCGLNKVLW